MNLNSFTAFNIKTHYASLLDRITSPWASNLQQTGTCITIKPITLILVSESLAQSLLKNTWRLQFDRPQHLKISTHYCLVHAFGQFSDYIYANQVKKPVLATKAFLLQNGIYFVDLNQ
jgi:hypothetical protein